MRRAARRIVKKEKNYVDDIKANTVCPFFQDATQYSIACQSLIKGATNYIKFEDKDVLIEFNNKFCTNFDMMNKCPHSKLLNAYYNIVIARREIKKAERMLNKAKLCSE